MRYVAIRSEGNLIPYDILDRIAVEDLTGQKPADFGLPKGRRLVDEISRVWADAQNLWSNFNRRRQSLTERDPYGTSITRTWIVSLLSDPEMLGFELKLLTNAVIVNNVSFAVSHRNGESDDAVPVHIEGAKIDLDRRLNTKLRTSPQATLQDFLNNSEHVLWGIVTNGLIVRLLRDSSRTSRPTYLEFDLESIFEGNRFTEFALFYRLLHRSRFPQPGKEAADCLLEKYYHDSIEQGLRIRDKLRDGVEDALKTLGTAFLQHPANEALRAKHSVGKLTAEKYHRQLLLLVYRLLFLMVAEERTLIVAQGENFERNQRVYDEWYSVARLRDRAARIVDESPFVDLWAGLKQSFSLFEYGTDINALSIPPLNGDLFDEKRAIPDLAGTELYNHDLLISLRRLSLFKAGNSFQRVNYSALDVEELGSVYESLLDFKPVIVPGDKGLTFDLRLGMERKSTGSYYTRPELVHELIESALVPVMEDRLAEAEKAATGQDLIKERKAKEQAILSMSVCDPACGSGHFLLAAARRLGKELARVRTGEDEPRPDEFHIAVRDAISHCVYGVDINPLAVDLCKLSLWLEGHWIGKPLSFLDHRIRCGNSLVGIPDPEVMAEGVPDEAFTAVTGDDKKIGAAFKKQNKQERASRQRGFDFDVDDHAAEYAEEWRQLEVMGDDNPSGVRRKAELYGNWRAGMQHAHDEAVADLWTAQFYVPLNETGYDDVCTTKDFIEFAVDKHKKPRQVAAAQALAQQNGFFNWYLEFPEVFTKGGFDAILANPPWDILQPEEMKFFHAQGATDIANLPGDQRKRAIAALAEKDHTLYERWTSYKRKSESTNKFIRQSGAFWLSAKGKLNTYSLFADLARRLANSQGRAGVIVPTGIATDDNNKDFFADLNNKQGLVSLFDFENREKLFPEVDSRMRFSLLTMSSGGVRVANVGFFLSSPAQIYDAQRTFSLSVDDFALLNPQTRTCPIFRTRIDASLTEKVYKSVPILFDEPEKNNPWGVRLRQGLFNMTSDSGMFVGEAAPGLLPLYEGKMIQAYDHRAASVVFVSENAARQNQSLVTSMEQYNDPGYSAQPLWWISAEEVNSRLGDWQRDWIIVFKDVTSATNERTAIFAVIPRCGVGHSASVLLSTLDNPRLIACLLANFNSIPFDFITRQKLSGLHMSFFLVQQLPVLPPQTYQPADIDFIVQRVLELAYSAWDMKSFAEDLGYASGPFRWNPEHRAKHRAELDAYYAHLYGLTRDEIRYVLDPTDVFTADFPSETFRVLKEHEENEFGEYRTRRLVLEAFDKLAATPRFRDEMPKRVSAFESKQSAVAEAGRS
jgi:hypothetical protein